MQKESRRLRICAPVGLHPLKWGVVGDEMEMAFPTPPHVGNPLLLLVIRQAPETDEHYLTVRLQQPCRKLLATWSSSGEHPFRLRNEAADWSEC